MAVGSFSGSGQSSFNSSGIYKFSFSILLFHENVSQDPCVKNIGALYYTFEQ